jgi:hypothetical protein
MLDEKEYGALSEQLTQGLTDRPASSWRDSEGINSEACYITTGTFTEVRKTMQYLQPNFKFIYSNINNTAAKPALRLSPL